MTRPSPAYASIGEALAAYYYYLLLLILVYASRGEALEAVPVLVTYLLASSIFRHDVAPVFATAYFFFFFFEKSACVGVPLYRH